MKKLIIYLIAFVFTFGFFEDSFARMGKGMSSGFRSYKSYKFNSQKTKQNNALSHGEEKSLKNKKTFNKNRTNSLFSGGIFKWLIGGMIFGALISFLMGNGLHFGTPGLLEIILIGLIVYFIFRAFSKAKQPQASTNIGNIHFQEREENKQIQTSTSEQINEELIKNLTKNIFIQLQEAWSNGDLSPVKNFLTDRMYDYLNKQLKELKEKGLKNIVKDIEIKDIEIVHVEEENNQKVVIVKINASLIDYIIDKNGNIIEGSDKNPVNITEYWAFVGKTLNWKLDDIKQVEN